MENKWVVLVNEQDHPLGVMEKLRAHELGCRHRAFSVCVVREGKNGREVLLQKRQESKYHSRGLWSNACCSHPQPGEPLQQAAEKRLRYEMGVRATCHWQGFFCYHVKLEDGRAENEVDHVFLAHADIEQPVFNPQEVQRTGWITYQHLLQDLKTRPKLYTHWLAAVLACIKAP